MPATPRARPPRPRRPKAPQDPQRWRLHDLRITYSAIRQLPPGDRPTLDTPAKVCRLVWPLYAHLAHEQAGVLGLDSRLRPIAHRVISRGTIDATILSPRDVIQAAILMDAAQVLIVHNHPSGDPTPSIPDRQLWPRLRAAGEIVAIPVADFLILADEHTAWSVDHDAPITF